MLEAQKSVNKEVLNPRKGIVGYNTNDVLEIVEYSKNLEKINVLQQTEINNKNALIGKLSNENETFKQNRELIKRNKIIEEQKDTIKEQKKEITRLKNIVNVLENNIDNLKQKFEREIDKWKNLFSKMCKAIDKVLKREPKKYIEDYEDLADSINYDYYDKEKDKSDDFDISL